MWGVWGGGQVVSGHRAAAPMFCLCAETREPVRVHHRLPRLTAVSAAEADTNVGAETEVWLKVHRSLGAACPSSAVARD